MKPDFLTKIRHDLEPILPVIQTIIREAEEATLARTNQHDDPMLNSPNLANLRGYFRWVLVPKFLEQAVSSGRLPGLTAHWVPLGGVSAFELRGKYTTVSPYHAQNKNETPRKSTLRRLQRIANESFQPVLLGFEQFAQQSQDSLLHLLLVHGEDAGEFAFLRAYYDGENPALYQPLSDNIMLIPSLLSSDDVEPVVEPVIGLKDQSNAGAGEVGG